MPPEWAPHSCCFMHWPHRLDNWRRGAALARLAFAETIRAISRFEPLILGVRGEDMESAQQHLHDCIGSSGSGGVELLEMDSDDSWMRDMGPTFLVKNDTQVCNVTFE